MRRHGRQQRERGGAARPRGRRAVEGQGGAGPRGVPPRQCRRTQLRARLSSCAFSPPAPHARPSWCAGGGGTRSAPVAMRCGALTTPLRLQVGLDHKDADEQTATEYWLTRFRPLCSSSTPAESSVICGVELQTCAITGEPCAGELCAGEPCWRGRNLRGRNRGSAQRSAGVRPAFGQRGAVCCCIECGCSHKPDSCGVRKARGAAATVRASCLCACVRARVVCAALRAAQRSQSR